MEKRYYKTGLSLYINYVVHGMGVLILMQNLTPLSLQWGTDRAGVSSVVAMLGIGRLIAIMISGWLSDKLGRRPFVLLGMVIYIAFFAGILLSPTLQWAMFFAVLAGVANSNLDSGTYPALMESFPEKAGTANVLIKAAVQIGQFLLPIIISIIIAKNLWFGWSFIVCIALLIANIVFISSVPFPDMQKKKNDESEPVVTTKQPASVWIDGITFVLYGFVSQATFYLISQYISVYGQEVANMRESASALLVSYYSMGSLLCVAVTAVLASRIKPIKLMVPYTMMSFLTITAMWLFPTPTVLMIGAPMVGFFAAGGVMQLGLTVMGEMFPQGKGTITGVFYTFGSIASFVIPMLAGRMIDTNPAGIMLMDTIISGIGFGLAIIMFFRYRIVVGMTQEA